MEKIIKINFYISDAVSLAGGHLTGILGILSDSL